MSLDRSQVGRWRRMAVSESRALRELYRAHGRIPRTAPLKLDVLTTEQLRRWRRTREAA